jgi:hypothetical protein
MMRNFCSSSLVAACLALLLVVPLPSRAAGPKHHTVFLGAVKKVPYSQSGDPAGARPEETVLKLRALFVDGQVKEWTTGESHDVTDRSFVVRRALKINDALPGDKQGHWVWQRGPWLLIDRATGHVSPLKLPDYNPGVSQVAWFRDYAAYCGVTASGKSLYAVVAQLAVRRPVLAKKLAAFQPQSDAAAACAPVEWQRDPLRVSFHPAAKDPVTFDIVPGSAALVEDTGDEQEAAPADKSN